MMKFIVLIFARLNPHSFEHSSVPSHHKWGLQLLDHGQHPTQLHKSFLKNTKPSYDLKLSRKREH